MSPPHDVVHEPTMGPPEPGGIKVRMYNPGFGDCFLLAFRADDGSARYALLDCGVHHQYKTDQIPDREARLRQIAADIAEATGGHLHVVAVTHEHTDHLYGFKYGRELFDRIAIDDLWLAWTEDPTDPIAGQLKQLYGMRIRALARAVEKLGKGPLAEALRGVLGFEAPNALASAGGTAAELDYLRTRSARKLLRAEDYRNPGEGPLTLPGVSGVKIYVLGPPKDTDLIKNLQKKSELYPKLTALGEGEAFTAAVLAAPRKGPLAEEDEQPFKRSCPFDESVGITKEDAIKLCEASRELEEDLRAGRISRKDYELRKDSARRRSDYGQFFRSHYGYTKGAGHGPDWRRIDNDWLTTAEELALNINSYTNNTSLVLAIELMGTQPRKVLLFAGDAQVGNWLSWYRLSWPGEGEHGETVDVEDLLRRTVLYKVAHHCSQNATLKQKGLELMEGADLVSMIPVDEGWAKGEKAWEHPSDKLLKRLKEKSRGRVMRTDEIPSSDAALEKPDEATEGEWQAFIGQMEWDRSSQKLWIQYTVQG